MGCLGRGELDWDPQLAFSFGDPGGCILDHLMEIHFVGFEEIPRVAGPFAGERLPGAAQREIEIGVAAGALALPDAGGDGTLADDVDRVCRLGFTSLAGWFHVVLIGHNSSR